MHHDHIALNPNVETDEVRKLAYAVASMEGSEGFTVKLESTSS